MLTDPTLIFIGGVSRSGTSLFSHLIDGHPRVMSFTDEVQFLKIAPKIKCWRNDSEQYFLHVVGRPFDRERGQNLPFSESIDPSVNWKLFGPWSAIRQSSDDVSKDKERLIGVIREGANERDIFLELASIYAELVDRRTVDWDHVLEKTPGNEYHFVRLRQLFPKVKFVHFVRDPFDNLRSRIVRSGVIASKKVNWLGAVNMAYEWKRSLIAGAYNYSLAPDHYRMVRYEDLVRKPEQVLRKLCDFLEIEFDPIVLKQTLKAGTDLHAKKGHENIDRSPGEIDQKASFHLAVRSYYVSMSWNRRNNGRFGFRCRCCIVIPESNCGGTLKC